jgi:hypothetical protein
MPSGKHKTYLMDGQGTLKLKKWSVSKFRHLLTDVGEVVKLLGEDFTFDKSMTAHDIGTVLITLGGDAVERLTRLIKESITEPTDLTEEVIFDWDADEYLGVLVAVIEMNLTEKLLKNLKSLKTVVSTKFPKEKEA